MDILDQIVENKRTLLKRQKEILPPIELRARLADARPRPLRSLQAALRSSSSGIIAEFKRKSPSKGWIRKANLKEVVSAYEHAGASACSILTDTDFFGGSLTDLREARQYVGLPLLRKDFILDFYQIDEAKEAGADAILLIAAVLSPNECAELIQYAHELGLEVLLEIHHEEELEYTLLDYDVLGVNNRDLGSFVTRVENSFRLAEKLPKTKPVISESGLRNAETIRRLRGAGFQGFLMGESLMKKENPGDALADLIREIVC